MLQMNLYTQIMLGILVEFHKYGIAKQLQLKCTVLMFSLLGV